MKIASISTTKNEADIIEGFVRHNSRFVDSFFFVDESVDTTRTILGKLQEEGFDITILNSSNAVYEQRLLITSALRVVESLEKYDWVVLLDADEILPDVSRDAFKESLYRIPPGRLAALRWQTFVPTSRDYFNCEDPLVSNFLPRTNEGGAGTISKIAVPRALFGVALIDPGNHGACDANSGAVLAVEMLPWPLGHFPVRSTEQIVVKNIVAAHVTSMKENKTAVEGWHVYESLEQMRAKNFDMSYDELLRLALSYAIPGGTAAADIDRFGSPIRDHATQMKYTALRYRSPLAALDREMEAMARQVAQHRRSSTKSRMALTSAQERMAEAMNALVTAQKKGE
jgi:hypothetical protein